MCVTSAIAGALCSVVYSICPMIVLWASAKFPVLVVCGMYSPFCLCLCVCYSNARRAAATARAVLSPAMYRSIHVSSVPEDTAAGRLLSNCCTGASCRFQRLDPPVQSPLLRHPPRTLLNRFPALRALQLLEVVDTQPLLTRRANHRLIPLSVGTERLALGRGTL